MGFECQPSSRKNSSPAKLPPLSALSIPIDLSPDLHPRHFELGPPSIQLSWVARNRSHGRNVRACSSYP